jgi:hypothetical protein
MELADDLLSQLLDQDASVGDRGVLLNALLRELLRGFSVTKLRPLLGSVDAETVKAGVWLVSELGPRCKPLLEDIGRLLRHPIPNVRFYAIDAILSCATPENGEPLACVVDLLGDPEAVVRWKATDFVARASPEQLRAALEYRARQGKTSVETEGLRWILGSAAAESSSIERMLRNSSAVLRKFGFAAALRTSRANDGPLRLAAVSDDSDIRIEASRELEMLERLSSAARARGR